jgi:hypothetical protein
MWEIRTRLTVTGFSGDPTHISAVIGVEPTKTWREGDHRSSGTILTFAHNGWSLSSPVDPLHTTPEESVRALLDLLPDVTAFQRLPDGAEVELSCSFYGLTERPGFWLSTELLARVAAIGASLDIDPYDFSSEQADADETSVTE